MRALTKDGVVQRRYFYDGNSNRTKVEDGASQVLVTATYNNQDQMLTYGTKTYEYDDFGQLKTVLDSATNIKEDFTYNTIGALEAYKKTDLNTSTVISDITYDNDAMGRRVSRRINGAFETLYIYDGGLRIVGEYNIPNAEFTQYVYVVKPNVPEYMIRGGVEYKIVSNEQGSVRYILEPNSGNIVQAINYDEFGNIINDTNPGFQPFGFAGGIYDRASKRFERNLQN